MTHPRRTLWWNDIFRETLPITLDQTAESLGLQTYDVALPQGWVDMIYRHHGVWPASHFVWSYDQSKIFGAPVPVTGVGKHIATLESRRSPGD